MFTPGDKLEFGHYTILKELGSGGMGVVYHCRDEFLQREIAIKMMLPELMADSDIVEVFRQEARLAAQLEHPNIVTIHNIGMENREGKVHHYIAMEFLPGGSLRDRIGKDKIPLEQAVDWMKQLASALNYAHKRGVVHQDIKPDNVFITHDGSVKIGDFGLAQIATGPAFERNEGKGSPAYMSPELCRGEPRDHRSDIYSLGAVFFEVLTGERPFKADGMIEMALKHATAPIPSAAKLRSDTPTILDKVLKYMMAKDPDSRLQSLNDALPSLEKLLLEMKVVRLGVGGKNTAVTEAAASAAKSEDSPGDTKTAEPVASAATAPVAGTIDCSPATEAGAAKSDTDAGKSAAKVAVKEAPARTPSRTLDPSKEKHLELLWTYKTGGPIGWFGTPSMHRSRKHVYLPSADGVLYAIDMTSGRRQWHTETGGPLLAGPIVLNDELYLPCADGSLYCIYAGDGAVVWKYQGTSPQVAAPAVNGDFVYIPSMDGSLKALTKKDGKLVWTYRCDDAIVNSPQVVDNVLFVASKDKSLHAIETMNGARKWNVEGNSPYVASVLASTDSVYCASLDGKINAYDIDSGNPAWTYESNSAFLCKGNLEFTSLNYCTKNGGLHSIDKFKGTLLWCSDAAGPVLGGVQSVGGNLYVGTRNGILHCFNAKTGELNWYHTFESGLESGPLVTSANIYQGTISGELHAFVAPPKAGK